jgi:hypothetical protein
MNDPVEIEVASWMKQFAAIDDRKHSLPDPSVIWLKAKVLQSAREVERAARPITTAQITSYLVVAGCWAAVLTWKWSTLVAWLNSFTPTRIILGASGAQPSPPSLTLLMTLVVLASATVMLAMHTVLAEE